MADSVKFTASELAAIDLLITIMQEEGSPFGDIRPTFTPVAAIVARAVIATAAVTCAKVPEDADKVMQIEAIASSLEGTTTLADLMELRSSAVKANATAIQEQGR